MEEEGRQGEKESGKKGIYQTNAKLLPA